MAQNDTPMKISRYAQDRVIKYANDTLNFLSSNWNLRSQLLERDLHYQREKDRSEAQRRAQAANNAGDPTKVQNVTVPVVQPQVDAVHSYLVEQFLSSYPVFPVVSKPEISAIAAQVDTIMGESAVYFQYVRNLQMIFKDGLKYNFMAAEVDWKKVKSFSVENDAKTSIQYGVPVEVVIEGNGIKRLDPYNTIVDTRVPPAEVHQRGEFAGYTELVGRVELKQRMLELDPTSSMNYDDAFECGSGAYSTNVSDGTAAYYVPQVNPQALADKAFTTTNWLQWAQLDTQKKINYSNMYELTTLYCRIIPKEFGIIAKASGVPQIFKFIIVNRKVLIYCERKTNAHNYLPIVVGQPLEDGLGYQTKSFADNAVPYQQLASSLYNAAIHSQRRKVFDRIAYDPSRINKADIDRPDAIARIPVKTEAYGKPIGEAFAVMPYRDEGIASLLAVGREVTEMADITTGQNRVQRGQFQKGNKTRQEFDTVMDKSEARPRTIALLIENSFIQPIKHILKYNILQYQPPQELYNRQTQEPVKIQPVELRKIVWEFKVADGVLPVSKLINFEAFGQFMQFAAGSPQMAAEWDIAGMFMYSLQLQGADWIRSFKRDPAKTAEMERKLNGQPANGAPASPTPGAA